MLLLLPPSEGKFAPDYGPTLDLDRLSFPELNQARSKVLSALMEVSRREDAAQSLNVGAKGAKEIIAQRDILTAPCAPARQIYTGVLYEAAQLHQGDDVMVFSGLFGVTRGEDFIPSYRLSMNVSLPGIGPLKTFWRNELAGWMPSKTMMRQVNGSQSQTISGTCNEIAIDHCPEDAEIEDIVDLRSELYRVTGPSSTEAHTRWWNIRIVDSKNKTISHMAKHYRGLLARALLDAPSQSVDEVARTIGTVTVEPKADVCQLTLVPENL
ncbi:hypothetical protein FHX77_000315 [Bifidobacterium commune]|uniref:Peroxide stress protein YaaA n=1 Tax=Bifidobacterium commune TaxID=1505727 RepID=A0A1C4H2V7_9BIFI|nr:peroxide stress protein YaaA [Bifidobacterium commune]MBB2954935.1 hypothetical protein [Bifidobacterium commune]SCC79082.1 hypothetical protein GA0061077_0565 [Bifidobacterium commune]